MILVIFIPIVLLVLFALLNRASADRWANVPKPPGVLVDGRWYARITGSGKYTVLIESRLGGMSPEWWDLQDKLAHHARVISYDRAGYGWSAVSESPRSSATVARELHALLDRAGISGPYILLGHSQGCLYLQHFARLYPQEVAACVFLDPISHENGRFATELPTKVYQGSGVDKRGGIRMMGQLARLGLLPLLKPLLLQSPPFFYYRDFSRERVNTIWRQHLRRETYPVVWDEYDRAFTPENTRELLAQPFPAVPLVVLYHTPAVIMGEIIKYGGLSAEEAQQVEGMWEELTKSYLMLSPHSQWIVAEHSSHMIPLEAPELVINTVTTMIAELETPREKIR